MRLLAIAGGAAVVVAVTGALAAGQAGTEQDVPEHGSVQAVAEQLAAQQADDRAELNADLAAAGEEAHAHMAQVLQELASAVPVDGAGSPHPASAAEVEAWHHELSLATSALETVEDGTSEQTVAREAFIGAAHLLQAATEGYKQLLTEPAAEREALTVTVSGQREAAVRLWQAGAAQLDTLTVGSGGGHVHLFLAPNGDPDAVPLEFREPEGHGS